MFYSELAGEDDTFMADAWFLPKGNCWLDYL